MDAQDQDPKEAAKAEEFKRELYRRSLDTIKVFNPTDEDYVVEWDGFPHRVRANSNQSFPRYIAEKYVREMKTKLINEMADKELKEIEAKMEGRGVADVKYNANSEFERSGKYKTSDPELIKDIYSKIWLGVEEKYGVDSEMPEAPGRADQRPIEEQILGDLDRPYNHTVTVTETQEEKPYPINKKKVVEEVSA